MMMMMMMMMWPIWALCDDNDDDDDDVAHMGTLWIIQTTGIDLTVLSIV